MISDVVSSLGLTEDFLAHVAGCSPGQMHEWTRQQREVPTSAARKLSQAVGVPVDAILGRRGNEPLKLPLLWRKAREEGVSEHGLKAIAVTRLLVARYDEVASLLENRVDTYRLLFEEIRQHVDLQDSPEDQGRAAADAFLRLTGLDQGAVGIGEVLRGALRSRGLLVIETPVNDRKLEGFCVPVGTAPNARPCLLANSYRTTWFRRNYVILHELAHAIFDLPSATAVFDVDTANPNSTTRIAEERADAFALHALLPQRLMVAYENRGLRLATLDEAGLARFIAGTHAEQRLIVRAALRYGLLTQEQADRLGSMRISRAELSRVTYHAVGLSDLPADKLSDPRVREWESRKTTFPIKGIRLPIAFVRMVLRALAEERISTGKAAELLMVTTEDLAARYKVHLEQGVA